MALIRATLGFRLHTGWAAVVAATGEPPLIDVLLRRRIELLPPGESIPRFVYHKAAELNPAGAAALVKRAAAAAVNSARQTLRPILEDLRHRKFAVHAAGIPTGATPVPDDLGKILGAHPLIHAAEGALFAKAVAAACEECGLRVITARERVMWLQVAEAFGMEDPAFRQMLDGLRASIGPPWSADQKTATAAALLALRTSGAPLAASRAPSKG